MAIAAGMRVDELARVPLRLDMEGLARLLGNRLPAYQNLITSYTALTAKT